MEKALFHAIRPSGVGPTCVGAANTYSRGGGLDRLDWDRGFGGFGL